MKLCWLLGLVAVALCEGNDVVKVVSLTEATPTENITTTLRVTEIPPGNRKNVTKRQIDGSEGKFDTASNSNSRWNEDDSYSLPPGKREKFSSWAGKRGNFDDSKENKRAKFSSWAGKRVPEEDVDPPGYSKRAVGFSSWGGKREAVTDFEEKRKLLARALAGYSHDPSQENFLENTDGGFDEEKRGKFSSWGGKRSDASNENKRKFSSWSGKRSSHMYPLNDPYSYLSVPISRFWSSTPKTDVRDENFLRFLQDKIEGSLIDKDLLEDQYIKGMPVLNNEIEEVELSDKKQEDEEPFSQNWGVKRKFSSWGGKRSDPYRENINFLKDSSDGGLEKRTKFSSWGGKRGLLSPWKSKYQGKRGKFSSWAGKRGDDSFADQFDEKRTRFSNWGGKRAMDQTDSYEDKRAKFSSWAGKRFLSDEADDHYDVDKRNTLWEGEKKKLKGRGFSSWGGKRSFQDDDTLSDLYDTDSLDENKRATKFSSWAGKRNQIFDEKRKFSSWGGKRDFYEPVEESKRTKFSSWAGKRSVNPDEGPEEDKRKESRKNTGLLRRYNRFNSWRGKKDNTVAVNSTEQTKLDDVNFNRTGDAVGTNKSKRGISNYIRQFEMIKRNPLFRAWIGRNYPDNPLMTWKRRPAFSSWGGKRSLWTLSEGDEDQDHIEENKRGKFSSWGGKRDHTIEKRSVQTADFLVKQKPNKKDLRTSNVSVNKSSRESRFYPRSSKDSLIASAIRPLRRQFYAWGGKRAQKS